MQRLDEVDRFKTCHVVRAIFYLLAREEGLRVSLLISARGQRDVSARSADRMLVLSKDSAKIVQTF